MKPFVVTTSYVREKETDDECLKMKWKCQALENVNENCKEN
ncbi:MAG: hypothetical protein U0K86_05560 [Agathobacter sp.]|nr:hypothetical protein [Agathobacter sp.]